MSVDTVSRIIYSFRDDYSGGGHPEILEAILRTNSEQQDGYGNDDYTKEAVDILKNKIENNNVDIHFVVGGTQANLIGISSILRPYESVISADTGHINTHETGAIEATGHKINIVNSENGKLTPEDIQKVLEEHNSEHMVKPRVVFISNSTEMGTLYKKRELEELYSFCRSKGLLLYLDGARLGVALSSNENDLTLKDISELVDIFYIGGTKNGALFGEAMVITNDRIKENFRYNIKQKGALLAKGRLLGIQFGKLFKDDLYFSLGEHSNSMARKLGENIKRLGYTFLTGIETNQIFPVLPNSIIEELSKKYLFYTWSKIEGEMSAIRLVTSWDTMEEMVDQFISDLEKYS